MDVTCERCGTEYEFDETLVSDRGTTVKCTNCGHLFKVFRGDASAPGAGKSWHVEMADGTTRTLGSLKELQRLITDGQLTTEDRISRGGEGWKRLGDIAELQTFFASASQTEVDFHPPQPRSRSSTKPGPGAPADQTRDERARAITVESTPTKPPPGGRGTKGTIIGMGGDPTSSGSRPLDGPVPDRRAPPPPARPAISKPPPAPPRPPPRPPVSEVAPSLPAQAAATMPARPQRSEPPPEPPISEPPPEPPQSVRPVYTGPPSARPLYLEDEEPVAPPRAKSRSALWVGLVVVLAIGVGVALGWGQIAPMLGLARAEDPALPFIEAGDAALAQDTPEGYESARTQYTQALAHGQNDPRVLTRLSRAHSLTAQILLFEASDLDAIAETDATATGRAQAIRADAGRHAGTARQRAEDAVRHGSSDPEAQIALADAMRLSNDLPRARSALERALTLSSNPSAEALRVAALIEAAEANGDLSAARPKAEEAVAEDTGMIRTRLLLARALLAERDVGGARRQVERILERNPQHGQAVALRNAIEEGRPPAPPTVAVPDGGIPDAGVAQPAQPPPPVEPVAQNTQNEPPPREGAEPPLQAGGAPPPGRDYSFYIRNADERLDRHDLNGARQFYEAARSVRPGGSEALTGLGYVALEQGDASGAADKFRQAAGQGYAEAYIGLGAAYRRMGRLQDSLTAYERYLERLPTGPRAAVARRAADDIRAQIGGGGQPEPPPENREPAPQTDPENLPPPRGMTEPPPNDVPAIGTED